VSTGMLQFAPQSYGGADVAPTGDRLNGEDVAIAQSKIGLGLTAQGICKIDAYKFTADLSLRSFREPHQIRGVGVSAAFQSACDLHEIFNMHIRGEWIAPRLGDFAFDVHRWRIKPGGTSLNQKAVTGLQQDVVAGISGNGFSEIHTQDLHRAVGLRPEKLRGAERSIGRNAARKKNCISQPDFTGSIVFSGRSHFPANPDGRRSLEVILAIDPQGIERLKRWRRLGICQSYRQVKTFDAGMEVGRIQPDDFG